MADVAEAVTITEFLSARIDEDEKAVAGFPGKSWAYVYGSVEDDHLSPNGFPGTVIDVGYEGCYQDGALQHVARWDPTRVLAECAAKRAIVEGMLQIERDPKALLLEPLVSWQYKHTLEWFIRPFAAVYASHPDYRQEWAL